MTDTSSKKAGDSNTGIPILRFALHFHPPWDSTLGLLCESEHESVSHSVVSNSL